MTFPADTWVAHVAAQTNPASIQWLTNSRDCTALENGDVPSERSRPPKPSTFMCARQRDEVSQTCEFLTRAEATARFWSAFRNSMRGRVMYVLPYTLGPSTTVASCAGGVQVTDDPRLAAALARTVHIDASIRQATRFVRSVHAVQATCAPAICCFADGRAVWAPAVSSSDLIDARPHALRLATVELPREERLAARMAVVRVPSTRGGERPLHYGVIAPFELGRAPSSLLGTRRERGAYRTLASEVVWLTVEDGQLHALLCEREPGSEAAADAETTTMTSANVPLDAIVFCTRRASGAPLVVELSGWSHGCYAGAMLAADADEGSPADPMGMSQFCGIDLNEYLDQWFALGARLRRPPKLFQLNWFVRGADGSLLWPALFEGWRIINWMTARLEGEGKNRATCAGIVPTADAIEREGLRIPDHVWHSIFDLVPAAWERELASHARALDALGKGAPLELHHEHRLMSARLREILVASERAEHHTKESATP
jgi:GTP-dependent phosphoenolpyruvate carboxykinase